MGWGQNKFLTTTSVATESGRPFPFLLFQGLVGIREKECRLKTGSGFVAKLVILSTVADGLVEYCYNTVLQCTTKAGS